ncbi:MAG TPA: kelch repeat-containing protein [Verrucomicrobiae bacterium]|nr:kelch repeat-containing protein [Verrucomicrobiae bacterium]
MPVVSAKSDSAKSDWKQLPNLPDRVGFAGAFAGVSHGALIVAGGANFPGAMPWDGGQKVWHDSIFILPKPGGQWATGFKLPRPLGYGVSVTTPTGVLCCGGSDAQQHFRDVFLLSWRDGRIEIKNFPPLPLPLANGCGALMGDVLYVAGGIDTPTATNALNNFWSLDLSHTNAGWTQLGPWPGPARMLSVAGAWHGNFYLFSGVSLAGDAAGKPVRRYLTDAYCFTPGHGWKKISDLPRAAVAAPSPAANFGNELIIVSGDDGRLVNFEPKSAHPGFPKTVLHYEPHADKWTESRDSLISRATAPMTVWHNLAVIPNGEARPGYRTPEMWGLALK